MVSSGDIAASIALSRRRARAIASRCELLPVICREACAVRLGYQAPPEPAVGSLAPSRNRQAAHRRQALRAIGGPDLEPRRGEEGFLLRDQLLLAGGAA